MIKELIGLLTNAHVIILSILIAWPIDIISIFLTFVVRIIKKLIDCIDKAAYYIRDFIYCYLIVNKYLNEDDKDWLKWRIKQAKWRQGWK